MRWKVWTAAFLFGAGLLTVGGGARSSAQGQGQNQGQPMSGTPAAPLGGVGMDRSMEAGKAPARGGALKIAFKGKSAEWSPESLAKLPHVTLTAYNEHAKENQTYSGVPLIELLKPLGVPDKPHGKDFRLYLEAEGADGYQVVYSVAEVTPDVHDGTVLVADSMDGKPLGDDGALKLVATGEKRPARWVRGLVAIRVLPAQ